MAATIEVRDLSHTYSAGTPFQHDAVKHMSFSVEKGEFLGIIGHTGSGKSTLIQHLNGLRPILCVGESLTEREQDVTMEVIRKQIKIALQNVAVEDIKKVVIAYEPIWAIGTGKTATAEQANEVCSAIRDCLREKYGARAARGITIQYGGSMNAKNASELLAQPDVDGGLIGGASLKSADFATIVEAANQ